MNTALIVVIHDSYFPKSSNKRVSIITIRADFQQGMELVPYFKNNTVTENYWLIYAAAIVIWPYHVGYYFQLLNWSKSTYNVRFHALLIVTILYL